MSTLYDLPKEELIRKIRDLEDKLAKERVEKEQYQKQHDTTQIIDSSSIRKIVEEAIKGNTKELSDSTNEMVEKTVDLILRYYKEKGI